MRAYRICVAPPGSPLVIRAPANSVLRQSSVVRPVSGPIEAMEWARRFQKRGVSVAIVPPLVERVPLP